MARTSGRVVLSKNVKENLDLAQKIYDKHVALGTGSPLLILEGIDWSLFGPKVADAAKAHSAAEDFKSKMEDSYQKRDVLMPEVTNALKKSIALLKASAGSNTKKLGDWGINVDDSKQLKK